MSWSSKKKEQSPRERLLKELGGREDKVDAFKAQKVRVMELLNESLDKALEQQAKDDGGINIKDAAYSGIAHTIGQIHEIEYGASGRVQTEKTVHITAMLLRAIDHDAKVQETIRIIEDDKA